MHVAFVDKTLSAETSVSYANSDGSLAKKMKKKPKSGNSSTTSTTALSQAALHEKWEDNYLRKRGATSLAEIIWRMEYNQKNAFNINIIKLVNHGRTIDRWHEADYNWRSLAELLFDHIKMCNKLHKNSTGSYSWGKLKSLKCVDVKGAMKRNTAVLKIIEMMTPKELHFLQQLAGKHKIEYESGNDTSLMQALYKAGILYTAIHDEKSPQMDTKCFYPTTLDWDKWRML